MVVFFDVPCKAMEFMMGWRLRAIFCLIVLCAGCNFFSDSVTVNVSFPPLPETWAGSISISRFTLKYLDDSGIQIETLSSGSPPTAKVKLHKYAVAPVVAMPECTDPSVLIKPAGAVFPMHVDSDGNLPLTWLNGFASDLLLSCASLGSQMLSTNADRLIREIVSKSGENPWRIDPEPIREGIAFGTLTVSCITILPTFDLDLSVPEGIWHVANPLDPGAVAWSDGMLHLKNAPIGFHSFFTLSGGERIHVQIDNEEWRAVFPSTGYGESGNW